MASNTENYDEKVRLVIGHILSWADILTKIVLTAYDPSKDPSANKFILGGSRLLGQSLSL